MTCATLHAAVPAIRPAILGAPDCKEVYGLLGLMKHAAARDRARTLGPGIFSPGPVRALAAAIVEDRDFDPRDGSGRLDAATALLIDKVLECAAAGNIDPDEPCTLSLLGMLAEQRYRDLLADQLAWTAGAIRRGQTPLVFARRTVDRAFAIAAGDAPMDTMESWEDAA